MLADTTIRSKINAEQSAIAAMDEAPRGPVAKPSRKKALGGAPTPPAAPGRQSPFSAPTVPPEFRRIWPGPTHVIAEDADGRVWQWGELALAGFLTNLMAPHPVEGVAGAVVSASSGNSFSVVVDDRGRAAAWGARDWMQLGVADAPSHRHAPVHPVLPAPICTPVWRRKLPSNPARRQKSSPVCPWKSLLAAWVWCLPGAAWVSSVT